MKNKGMLVMWGVVVLLLAVLGYQLTRGGGQVSEEGALREESAPKTLSEMMTLGNEVVCSYNYDTGEGGSAEGSVYVALGKSRSDYTTTVVGGESFSGSVIVDGEYSYVWGSTMEGGIKMKLTEEVGGGTEGAPVTSDYVKLDEVMDYRCEPWTVDQSKFAVPAGIEFKDLGAMMDEARIEQCKVCATLDAEARVACEGQLGC